MKKQVIFTMGGKGGTGKTTFMTALGEWLAQKQVPVVHLDLDTENKRKGSLVHFFEKARKIDIHTPAGLDSLIDCAEAENALLLADMGAGSGKVTYEWFDTMYDTVSDTMAFVAVGVITSDPASVESLLSWAKRLQDRADYLIVLNKLDLVEEEFLYWEESEEAARFRETFKPKIIRMAGRIPDLQHLMRNHGATLTQVIERQCKAPELNRASLIVRAQSYRRQLFNQLDDISTWLLP
jgi:MinD-like ATPase involved in chromosome partitioning or flagellar assembly